MLQTIRERAQGVIAWIIVILITIPFALWGIQEYLGVGSEPVVVTVNDRDITEREFENRYRDFRQNLRQRLGSNYRPELLDETILRQEVLDSMIRNELIMQSSDELGLRAGDDLVRQAILSIPAFQVNGQFSQEAYQRALQSQGLTPSAFEERVRSAVVSEQLSKAVGGSAFTTRTEIEAIVRLRMQQRTLSYLIIPAEKVAEQIDISDQEIKAHYEANPGSFMAPEQVKVEYIDLDIDNITSTLTVDEEALRGYYEQHKNEYIAPEQRRARHILFAVDENADEEALREAEEAARNALQRLREGEDFAALAKSLSQDPGSADLGGDLGYFESGIMDKAFDEAVFSMQEGEISEPVRSAFGFHIIELTSIRPEQGKTLNEARSEIESAYLKSEAQRLFYDYAERLSNLAYEDPNSLQPAADELGMTVQKSDWITRDSDQGIFAAPKVMNAIFSEDVLRSGNNSEAIELGAEHVVVVRVAEHEESLLRPLDEVREEVHAILEQQKSAELTRAMGEQLIAELQAGADLAALAADKGLTLETDQKVRRDSRELPSAVVRSAFRIPKPTEGAVSYGQAELPDGGFAVIALSAVEEGSLEQVAELGGEEVLDQALQRARADRYFKLLVDDLRSNAKIVMRNKTE